MWKSIIISLTMFLFIIGGTFLVLRDKPKNEKVDLGQKNTQALDPKNVTIENGVQIIKLTARGGYQPRQSFAQPGLPTILRIDTNGTFDCSASIRIPALKISQILPQSGTTDLALGSPATGILRGTCGMGMYSFEINFK